MENNDFSTFNNDTATDEEYMTFVEWLSARTADELRQAKGNPVQQKQMLCRYYRHGDAAHLTASELIDFLAVSTPSILDMAEYSEEEANAIMVISDSLTDEEIFAAP